MAFVDRGRTCFTALLALAVVLALAACSARTDRFRDPTGDPAVTTTTNVPGPVAALGAPAELPSPRTEVAGAAWMGQVAVAGGLLPSTAASPRFDLWSAGTQAWAPGPDLPVALHHLGMAALGDRLYVAGGFSNQAGGDWRSQTGVWSLGSGEARWRDEPPLRAPRAAHGLAAVAGRLVAVAGLVEGRLTASTESWAPGERSWTAGPALGQPREHLAVTTVAGRAFAIGGRLGGIDTNLRSVESWAPGEAAWRAEPQLNDTRGGTSAATVGDRACAAGGEEPAGTIASVECLSGGAWARVATLKVPRHGLAVVALDGRLHVVGGGPRPGLFVSGAHEVLAVG